MKTVAYRSWRDLFSKFLGRLSELSPERMRQLVFRGQASSRWPLRTSLDRARDFTSTEERQAFLTRLVGDFRRQARSLIAELGLQTELEWELLGRHHGLPTSVLDFSRSPYVAAYFAFAEPPPAGDEYASVWALDLEAFARRDVPEIDVIDEDDQIRFNPRAQEQQGLFVRIKGTTPIENVLGDFLQRHDIPHATRSGQSQRTIALNQLDAMMINARRLFRDLDAAAKTAAINVLVLDRS